MDSVVFYCKEKTDELFVKKEELEKRLLLVDPMPTASASNLGVIVQYKGITTSQYTHGYFYECVLNEGIYYWKNISVQPALEYEDLSILIANNEYNKTNLTFNKNKCRCTSGFTLIKQDIDLKNKMTDYTSERKKLMELPELPEGYEYPSKTYITLVKPEGQVTCMENKDLFFSPEGEEYIDPNIGRGSMFVASSYEPVEDAHDEKGDSILIVKQLHNPQSGQALVDEKTGKPVCLKQRIYINEGEEENPKAYILANVAGEGYHYINKYYDGTGQEITGDFYELQEIEIAIDTEYLYKCYLADQMKEKIGSYTVDENGVVGRYMIHQDATSELIGAFEYAQRESDIKFRYGLQGTVMFIPAEQVGNYTMVEGRIESNVLTISGENTVESFRFSEVS